MSDKPQTNRELARTMAASIKKTIENHGPITDGSVFAQVARYIEYTLDRHRSESGG